MNRNLTRIFGLAVIAGVTLSARPAGAQVAKFSLHDHFLIADFEDASDDGCFVTQTEIRFTESVSQSSGTTIVGPPTTQVTIVYANGCTGEFFGASGGTTQQTFHIAPDLGSATLAASVPVIDDAGASSTVTVDVSWKANAPTQKAINTTVTRGANTITVDHVDFRSRAADVSGTVAAVLFVQAGPTVFDLARFPEGGQVGKDTEGTRTVTFIDGHP
jgi:hypothetical protein